MAILLGLDIGGKRVGVAFADESTGIAFPLQTLHFKTQKELTLKLQEVISAKNPEKIIVGLPLTLTGEVGEAAQRVQKRVESFKKTIETEWEFVDESLSTCEAEEVLIAGDVSRKKRKEVVDKLAAQRILQYYLDLKK